LLPPAPDALPLIPGASILDFERYAILKTLQATGGSSVKTAEMLGISVRKIQYRLQEYRATHPDPPSSKRIAFRTAR
jgi:DNA-binding NtrC family response regulator